MNETIDIRILLASMLAENENAYKSIDKIYSSKKELLFNVIQENKEWRDLFLTREGSIIRELYLLKVMAMLSVDDEEVQRGIIDLTKKTYKSSYNFIMSKKKLVLQDYIKNILKKNNKIDDSTFKDMLLSSILMAHWFGIEVDLDDESYNFFISKVAETLKNYDDPFTFKVNDLDNEDKKLVKQVSSNLKTNYLKEYYPPVHSVSPEKIENGFYINEKLDNTDKFLLALNYIYDNERITLKKLARGVKITDKDIDDIVATYLYLHPISTPMDVDYKDLYLYVCVTLNEISLIRAYKKARDLFVSNLDLDYHDILKDKAKENEELKAKIQQLQEENEKLKNNLSILEKRNTLLADEISNFSNTKKELTELRNHIFTLSNNEEDIDDDNLLKLKDINAVCFGGQPKWIAKMKDIVNWKFISSDTLNFDVDIIKNSDYVFINTSYISHGMYYKIIENITKDNKLKYINNTNIQRCLNDIVIDS